MIVISIDDTCVVGPRFLDKLRLAIEALRGVRAGTTFPELPPGVQSITYAPDGSRVMLSGVILPGPPTGRSTRHEG